LVPGPGGCDPDSDMDVLVVLDGPVSNSPEIVSDNAWEVGFEAGIVVLPIVVSRESWEKGPERVSLLASAVREEGCPYKIEMNIEHRTSNIE